MEITDRLTLLNGDCLAVMRDMPDASVDSVCCDPPYGLSAEPDMAEVMRHWMAGDDYSGRFREGQNNCASHIVRQTRVVDANNAQADGVEKAVTFRINFNPLPVRVGPVEFDHGRLLWKKEIDADRPGRSGEHLLVDERYGQLAEMLRYGQFGLRERQGHAACVGVCACCAKGVQSSGAILVRLDDNALTDAERSGGVVAFGGTELTAVLTFDVTRGTVELRPAAGAEKLDAGFLLVRTERVGTSAAAGSLPPELEALGVGAVGDATNGTISVHFDFLERLENPIIEQKGFMGRTWDSFVPGPSVWREAFRVLKPGGHLAAFFGTRTYDIGTLAIRLAGFEVRDQLAWVYAQGFPKSHNMDNYRGKLTCGCDGGTHSYAQRTETLSEHDMRLVPDADVPSAQHVGQERGEVLQSSLPQSSPSSSGAPDRLGQDARTEQSCMEGWRDVPPSAGQLRPGEVRSVSGGLAADGSKGWVHHGAPAGDGTVGRSTTDTDRGGAPQGPRPTEQRTGQSGVVADEPGPQVGGAWPICSGCGKPIVPAGIGTALKPAWEPICLARKPLIGTVASNVLAHGTGGINVDGCRVAAAEGELKSGTYKRKHDESIYDGKTSGLTSSFEYDGSKGRFPANLIHDGSDDVLAGFPYSKSTGGKRTNGHDGEMRMGRTSGDGANAGGLGDEGSAARFFYCAKASRSDRQEGNDHPTVKPTPLMEWLARLVTPPGGLVLDPFMGSGSTGKACHNEGFRFVGVERDPDYYAMAVARIWDHVST